MDPLSRQYNLPENGFHNGLASNAPNFIKAQKEFTRLTHGVLLPIPKDIEEQFTNLGRDIFGTSSNGKTPSLYNIQSFIEGLESKPTKDFVFMGVDGHGMNSNAMHYYLASGSLILLLQREVNPENQVTELNTLKGAITNILNKIEKELPEQTSSKILIVESDFHPELSGWRFLDSEHPSPNPEAWVRNGHDILSPMFLAALRELK